MAVATGSTRPRVFILATGNALHINNKRIHFVVFHWIKQTKIQFTQIIVTLCYGRNLLLHNVERSVNCVAEC